MFAVIEEEGSGVCYMARRSLRALLAVCVLFLTPVPASATFHLMEIVEIFPGTDSDPAAQYVMLQMYAAGQNLVHQHFVEVFDTNGQELGKFTFTQDVANGADMSTVLIATAEAQSLFNLEADLQMMPTPGLPGGYLGAGSAAVAVVSFIQPAGGAVCYDFIDCVAWGTFSATAAGALTVQPEKPFIAPTGLTLGMAMHRDILDSLGKTNDFALAPPEPKNNAGQTGQISETPTPTPSATVTPTGVPNTPVSTATVAPTSVPANTPVPTGMGGGGGGGGGCGVAPLVQDTRGGALLVLLPLLSLLRWRGKGLVSLCRVMGRIGR
jgi:hypothetical protein